MIEFGDQVQDGVTGFEGIATGRATFMTGCERILIERGGDAKEEEKWVDVARVVLIHRAAYRLEKKPEEPPTG